VARPPQQTRPEASPPASVTETVRPSGQNGQGTRAALNPPAKRPITAAKDIGFLEPEDDSDTAIHTEGKETIFADVTLFIQRVQKLDSQRTGVLTFLPDTLRGKAQEWYSSLEILEWEALNISGINGWCNKLLELFMMKRDTAWQELSQTKYTVSMAAAQKPLTTYHDKILWYTRALGFNSEQTKA